MEARQVSLLVLVAVLAVHNLHGLFPEPTLAFFIGRGWLGVLAAWLLWRGWRITWPTAAVWALYEGSASACGVLYVGMPAAFGGLCDAGTGLPVNLLGLTGAALALAATMHDKINDKGRNG